MDALNELSSRQLLEPASAGEVRFVHDQIREAAYASLTDDTRRALHHAVVAAIESQPHLRPSQTRAAELAYHSAAAREVRKAVSYAEEAGEAAFHAGAFGDAISQFEAAMKWSHQLDGECGAGRLGAWHRYLGEAYHTLGDVEHAGVHLSACLAAFGIDIPSSGFGRLAFATRLLLGRIGVGASASAPRSSPNISEQELEHIARAAARLAFSQTWKNDSGATVATTLLATVLGDRTAAGPPTGVPYMQLGFILGLARLRGLERRYFAKARSVATENRDTLELAGIFRSEAYLRAGEAQWTEARRLCARSRELLGENGGAPERDYLLAVQGFIARWTGQYHEALELAERLRISAHSGGNVEHEVWSTISRAACLCRLRRHRDATPSLEHAIQQLSRRVQWVSELRATAHLAEACVNLDQPERARTLADRALTILDRSNGPPLLCSAIDGVGGIAHVYLCLQEEARWGKSPEQTLPILRRSAQRTIRYMHKLAVAFPVARHSYELFRARALRLEGRRHAADLALAKAKALAAHLGIPFDNGWLPLDHGSDTIG